MSEGEKQIKGNNEDFNGFSLGKKILFGFDFHIQMDGRT